MRAVRNVAIILLLAVPIAFMSGGGNAVDAILTAITMAFFTLICWQLYRLSRQNQLVLATLSDGRRAILYGAFGLLALLIAGIDRMFSTGIGTLLWILLLAAAVVTIWRVWLEANTY